MSMSTAALAFAGVSAFSQYRAGQAQQTMYDAQAKQAEIQARSEAIAYKQKSADILSKLNETLASTVANAAANGIDALSGSALALQNYSIREGGLEYHQARDNAAVVKAMGQHQATIYRSAGKTAFQQGVLGAATTLGSGYLQYKELAPSPAPATGGSTTAAQRLAGVQLGGYLAGLKT